MSATRLATLRSPWAFLAIILATCLLAPALIGRTITGPDQQQSFLTRPWNGWTLAATMLRHGATSPAASPGGALAVAHDTWPADERGPRSPAATSAHLVYNPGAEPLRFTALGASAEYRTKLSTTHTPLVWTIEGRYRTHGSQGIIGVIDYASARVLWDVRDDNAQAHIDDLTRGTATAEVNSSPLTVESVPPADRDAVSTANDAPAAPAESEQP